MRNRHCDMTKIASASSRRKKRIPPLETCLALRREKTQVSAERRGANLGPRLRSHPFDCTQGQALSQNQRKEGAPHCMSQCA